MVCLSIFRKKGAFDILKLSVFFMIANQETGAARPETYFSFLREAKRARSSSPPPPNCEQRVRYDGCGHFALVMMPTLASLAP